MPHLSPASHAADQRRDRRRVAAMLLAPLLLAGSGCARAGADRARPGEDRPTSAVLDTSRLRLPLDAYLGTAAEESELTRAYRVLLRRCMARYRFAFPPTDRPRAQVPLGRNERRYGLISPAAATRGYRYPAGAAAPSPPDRSALRALPLAGRFALYGDGGGRLAGRPVPPGGCLGEATRTRYPTVAQGVDPDLPQRLSRESFTRSRRDPRVQAATHRWAACMAAGHHPYATPFDPADDPRFRGPLSRVEVETAKLDLTCKRRTGLVTIWVDVESALQRALVAEHATALEQARAVRRARLAVARAATAPSTPAAAS